MRHSKGRVLIVEDDGLTRDRLKHMFEKWGYQTICSDRGMEAVDIALKEQPNLILMDVRLKDDINGVKAARMIQNQICLPLVYLTAYDDDQLLADVKRTFPYGYLIKPVRERELKATIEIALFKFEMEEKMRQKNCELEREIKERKRVEQELIKATQAKSEFLARMSHEIRTPINSMLGFAQLLLDEMMGPLNEVQIEYLEHIIDSTNRLLYLINDILDFSKVEAGKIKIDSKSFNIHPFMNRIRQTLSGLTFTKNIRYEVIIEKNVPQNIMGDDFRIEQILKNLVSNAVKFTEKGQIEVFVKRQDKNVLLFQVRDTGIGISKENIDGLFTKFYQINTPYTKTYAGTGLGLAISKELSELMGGRIWCESEPGKGSSFFFTIRFEIPDEQPELSEKEKLKHSDEINQPKRALRILLAEDDYLSNKTITHFLKHEGHTIRHAENGKEALALLESENFDLVLMDVQMPEMDGIEATKQIRKAISDNKMNSKIPIIAITALAMRGDKERFLDAGMNDYISKPIDYDLLFDKIDRLC